MLKRRALLPLVAALSVACSGTDRCVVDGAALLRQHLDRYPGMQPADGYKLLHQASMGSEHAVPDAAAAREWMAREWEGMGDGPDEPRVDTLGTGGRFARVNLRPWRRAGGSPDVLAAAFVRTANMGVPDTAALSCALDQMASLATSGDAPWSPDDVQALIERQRAAGYAALHHGDSYRETFRPAYRVIALELVPALLDSLTSSPRP